MKIKKPLPNFNFLNYREFLLVMVILFLGLQARADKLELSAGFFQLAAKNSRNNSSSSISGVGSYHVAYHTPFRQQFEFDIGYSLIASKTFSGDLSFGLDIGVNYFFMTSADQIKSQFENSSAIYYSHWRPFIGLGFSQRNFQSTDSQYVGMGAKLGTEYQIRDNLALLGYIRIISLGGPNQSKANLTEGLLGTLIHF